MAKFKDYDYSAMLDDNPINSHVISVDWEPVKLPESIIIHLLRGVTNIGIEVYFIASTKDIDWSSVTLTDNDAGEKWQWINGEWVKVA